MTKTYTFQNPYYTIEVPVTTVVAALAIPYCAYHAIKADLLHPALMCFFIAAAIYQVWNVLVSAAYPHHVVVDDESISFCSATRTDRYVLDEITDFHARANPRDGRIFLRINNPTIFRGRYWMSTQDMNDGEELFSYINALEIKVHPDGLKAKAMKSNEDFLERQAKLESSNEEKTRLKTKAKKKRGARSREASLGTKTDTTKASMQDVQDASSAQTQDTKKTKE